MSGPFSLPTVTLIRLPGLMSRHGHVLSAFEHELLTELVLRFRDRGARMTMTLGELATFDLAVSGLDAAQRAAVKAAAEAAAAALAADRGAS